MGYFYVFLDTMLLWCLMGEISWNTYRSSTKTTGIPNIPPGSNGHFGRTCFHLMAILGYFSWHFLAQIFQGQGARYHHSARSWCCSHPGWTSHNLRRDRCVIRRWVSCDSMDFMEKNLRWCPPQWNINGWNHPMKTIVINGWNHPMKTSSIYHH